MAALAPAARTDSRRLPRHLLLAALAVLAAAVVLALLPRREEPLPAVVPAPAQAAAPLADAPLRVPAGPVENAPAPRQAAVAAPVVSARPAASGRVVVEARAAPPDDLGEDAAAAGMTSRAEAGGPTRN